MSKHHTAIPKVVWQRLRIDTFNRDGWRCRQCGKASVLECHHVIPLDEWPDQPWTVAGLLTLCRGCHIQHHRQATSEADREWADFLDELAS